MSEPRVIELGLTRVDLSRLEGWAEGKYKLQVYGDDFSVIMIGEVHADLGLERDQRELIELLRPEYVVHELLGGWTYDSIDGILERQDGSKKIDGVFKADDSRHVEILGDTLIELARKLNFRIVGCDLEGAERQAVENKLGRGDGENRDAWSSELMQFRDDYMAEQIVKYYRKSSRPVVVIIGAEHARGIHRRGLLKNKEFGYVFIDQSVLQKSEMGEKS